MNFNTILSTLIGAANDCDDSGFLSEGDRLTRIAERLAQHDDVDFDVPEDDMPLEGPDDYRADQGFNEGDAAEAQDAYHMGGEQYQGAGQMDPDAFERMMHLSGLETLNPEEDSEFSNLMGSLYQKPQKSKDVGGFADQLSNAGVDVHNPFQGE